ncbi:uncharacterized protein LOC131613101 [Vicia villosa]|uniref:uncharacterized protein LOC131613101 n=1 Tax=Vicia villosa TaxID=3911 RepID=UPI00273B80E0|nr:uncharacterized protein LOC131613101 [Vicia villosa]
MDYLFCDSLNKIPNNGMMSLSGFNSGWHSLMYNNILEMINESFSLDKNTESHYINSFPKYSSIQHERPFTLLLYPQVVPIQTLLYEKSRGFSSNADTIENNANNNSASASKDGLRILYIQIPTAPLPHHQVVILLIQGPHESVTLMIQWKVDAEELMKKNGDVLDMLLLIISIVIDICIKSY